MQFAVYRILSACGGPACPCKLGVFYGRQNRTVCFKHAIRTDELEEQGQSACFHLRNTHTHTRLLQISFCLIPSLS